MEKYAIVLAGPSGVGKTTVAEGLIKRNPLLEETRSATTRDKRGDGKDDEYTYVTKEEFLGFIERGEVVEYTEYGGNYYGTVCFELDRILSEGKIPILVLDYNGARSLKRVLDYPVFAIYIYTSLDEAASRLEKRELTAGKSYEDRCTIVERRRRENACDYKEVASFADVFDAFVENENLERCIDDVEAVIEALKCGKTVTTDSERSQIACKLSALC
jgi:guanylate kinase